VRVFWGRLNGGQPDQFSGVISITQEITATTYIMVFAEYAKATGQWSNRNLIFSGTADLENTSTRVYAQIGTITVTEDGLNVASACGPVDLSPCDLVIEEGGGDGGDES